MYCPDGASFNPHIGNELSCEKVTAFDKREVLAHMDRQ
jgi:hypothetical protein